MDGSDRGTVDNATDRTAHTTQRKPTHLAELEQPPEGRLAHDALVVNARQEDKPAERFAAPAVAALGVVRGQGREQLLDELFVVLAGGGVRELRAVAGGPVGGGVGGGDDHDVGGAGGAERGEGGLEGAALLWSLVGVGKDVSAHIRANRDAPTNQRPSRQANQ